MDGHISKPKDRKDAVVRTEYATRMMSASQTATQRDEYGTQVYQKPFVGDEAGTDTNTDIAACSKREVSFDAA